nr:ROK family protein [Kineosporia babensis]
MEHENDLVAGIDIGGTSIKAVLCSGEDLSVLARASAPTPRGGQAMIDTSAGLIRSLTGNTEGRLVAAGLGAAGVIDRSTGTVVAASDSFSGWTGFPAGQALRDALGVPVRVDNDVNAFIRGEVRAGAAVGARHALGIMLGTGVGGALWLDGELYEGLSGAAGEIGHLPGYGDLPCTCGGTGHLETLASGRSISARYRELSASSPVTSQEVALRARQGDPHALSVFRTAGQALGHAVLVGLGLLGLGTVVVGGGVARAWDLLGPAIEAEVRREPPVSGIPVHVVPGKLDADAVALGAAAQFSSDGSALANA